jgi:hypothetical protein
MYDVNTDLEYLFPNKRSTVGLKIQSIMEWRVGDERRIRVLEPRNTFRLRKEDWEPVIAESQLDAATLREKLWDSP